MPRGRRSAYLCVCVWDRCLVIIARALCHDTLNCVCEPLLVAALTHAPTSTYTHTLSCIHALHFLYRVLVKAYLKVDIRTHPSSQHSSTLNSHTHTQTQAHTHQHTQTKTLSLFFPPSLFLARTYNTRTHSHIHIHSYSHMHIRAGPCRCTGDGQRHCPAGYVFNHWAKLSVLKAVRQGNHANRRGPSNCQETGRLGKPVGSVL